MNTPSVYADYAATTPVDPAVLAAMQPYLTEKFYNPSALYLAARAVRSDLEQTRSQVARIIGSRPSELIFTSGATEADNLAIAGIMQRHPEARVAVSAIEHDAVWLPAQQYACDEIPVQPDGRVLVADALAAITDETVLVSLMYACNETGIVQPVRELANSLQDIRKDRQKRGISLPLYLHTDAAQAANYLDIQVGSLGADLMTLSGSKTYGPKQSGCLYVRAGIDLAPMLLGGGQEMGYRSGTESVAQAAGFAEALRIAQSSKHEASKQVAELTATLWQHIQALIPAAERTATNKHRLPNILSIRIPDTDNERLVMELDERAIMAAQGSACKASSDEPSRVLISMGKTPAYAGETIRFSLGRYSTQDDVTCIVAALNDILREKH